MTGEERRDYILQLLSDKSPIKGTSLGEKFDVSRQVIVQDIALLRAQGHNIIATPQGYLNNSQEENKQESHIITVASQHSKDDIEAELNTIVDYGGNVLDVVVEHPIYGELTGQLMLSSRRDIRMFINRLQNTNANPLAVLTGGVHLHHIEVPNEKIGEEIKDALKEYNFLVEEEG